MLPVAVARSHVPFPREIASVHGDLACMQRENHVKNSTPLRLELQTLKELNRMLEEQVQNHAFINADLDTQLTETELKEAA